MVEWLVDIVVSWPKYWLVLVAEIVVAMLLALVVALGVY